MVEVGIVSKTGVLPEYATPKDTGMDLRACIDEPVILKPGEIRLIKSGITVELPEGYGFQVRSRSGQALKKGLVVLNSPGTIDEEYRNEIGIILYNASGEDQIVEPGDRIAQLVLEKVEQVKWVVKDTISADTKRGLGGYGHTGRK